ncbi:MAG: hypothetical protein BroJett011_22680 [Chloroflexota bacterium]|nr:MAG: hypothetical protein BroJett011_22680 [Chloroflexota bacterium]
MDLKTMTYIQSEAEYSRARSRAFWDIKRSLMTGHRPYLLPFDEVIRELPATSTIHLGLQDILLKNIVGSVGRSQDFTRHFMPRVSDERSKERWRTIYTLIVSGVGLSPIEVFKIGPMYFVQNGHHRVSVTSYLGWPTIQAYVTVLPSPRIGGADVAGHSLQREGVH